MNLSEQISDRVFILEKSIQELNEISGNKEKLNRQNIMKAWEWINNYPIPSDSPLLKNIDWFALMARSKIAHFLMGDISGKVAIKMAVNYLNKALEDLNKN